jgi:hypothetical protein
VSSADNGADNIADNSANNSADIKIMVVSSADTIGGADIKIKAVSSADNSTDNIADNSANGGADIKIKAVSIAFSASQEEEHVKDPRKLWGLSDTCPREKETSSLFQQDVVISNTQPYTRSPY